VAPWYVARPTWPRHARSVMQPATHTCYLRPHPPRRLLPHSPSSAVTRLGLSAPLRFTHLGERLTFAGDDCGHVLDMRAEVAVLNRSVRVMGDPSSADTMYGAHVSWGWRVRRG
jgi:hypothetical protein